MLLPGRVIFNARAGATTVRGARGARA